MTWWDTDYATFVNNRTENKVAIWPAPNGGRLDARFKMVGSEPSCASRASRYIFSWEPFEGGPRYFAVIDVTPTGNPFELSGETPEDPHGRVMKFVIQDHQETNLHPVHGEVGISHKFILSLPSHTDWTYEWFYPSDHPGPFFPAPVSLRVLEFSVPLARRSFDPVGADTAWQSDDDSPPEWYTLSECESPFGGEKEFAASFAEFNGVDSYIKLNTTAGILNVPFVLKADIRRRDFPWIWPIFGVDGTGGFFGMDLSQLVFGNLTLDTDWDEVDDVWMKWEYRFEQDGQLRHQLFIDDVEVMDRTVARQNFNPNILGVYRHNSFPEIWGHFDMKNLIYLHGEPGDHTVRLDMPLTEDAQDHGPLGNDGTTHNMDLPSIL